MRLLHTSDWHLGRSFHRVDLLSAQEAVIDHLVEVVRSERVDAVVIAGDVYDRALPGVDAVALLDDTLRRLASTGTTVILSSGNHDSARRLGFCSDLLTRAGVHVHTEPTRVGEPVVLEDSYGPVAVYPIPYLEPGLVADALGSERSHAAVLEAAAARVRADLAGRDRRTRSVVAAHAFLTGGATSDSERDLAVGGVACAPLTTFDGVDYVALGHLHGRQRLASAVRYSGSPLAYSFSEADHTKGAWLVTLGRDGLESVEAVDTPVPRRLARLRGTLRELLDDPRLESAESAWCQVTLTDPVRPAAPMDAVRRRFPHTLELRMEPSGGTFGSAGGYAQRIAGRGDIDVCCGFLEHVRGGRTATAEEAALLREAVEAGVLAQVEQSSRARPGAASRARPQPDVDIAAGELHLELGLELDLGLEGAG